MEETDHHKPPEYWLAKGGKQKLGQDPQSAGKALEPQGADQPLKVQQVSAVPSQVQPAIQRPQVPLQLKDQVQDKTRKPRKKMGLKNTSSEMHCHSCTVVPQPPANLCHCRPSRIHPKLLQTRNTMPEPNTAAPWRKATAAEDTSGKAADAKNYGGKNEESYRAGSTWTSEPPPGLPNHLKCRPDKGGTHEPQSFQPRCPLLLWQVINDILYIWHLEEKQTWDLTSLGNFSNSNGARPGKGSKQSSLIAITRLARSLMWGDCSALCQPNL